MITSQLKYSKKTIFGQKLFSYPRSVRRYFLNTKSIMVVEDENIIALDLKKRVLALGYNIYAVVPTGEEAIEKVDAVEPDLILMDIFLRGSIDGVEAAREISKRHRVPIIYITAYSDEITMTKIHQSSAFGYIYKPFSENELRNKIEKALKN